MKVSKKENKKCYKNIYCCFNEEKKEAKQVLVEAFVNYLEKNRKKLEKLPKES